MANKFSLVEASLTTLNSSEKEHYMNELFKSVKDLII